MLHDRLQDEVRQHRWITLIGSDQLVPHQTVLAAIQQADAGILSYPYAHHTLNSHPTKLFEYLSARLPIILENNWPWIEHYAACQPFLFCDFSKPDGRILLAELKTKSFYTRTPEEVNWSSEAPRFLKALENL